MTYPGEAINVQMPRKIIPPTQRFPHPDAVKRDDAESGLFVIIRSVRIAKPTDPHSTNKTIRMLRPLP
jgi:hypothetical protein